MKTLYNCTNVNYNKPIAANDPAGFTALAEQAKAGLAAGKKAA